MSEGWISLHRKFANWEWYDHIPTKVLFLHLLIKANHKDEKWRGIDINRGQRLTSLQHLCDETGLTLRQIRTALKNLKTTREVTSKTTNKYTIISITNYDFYQSGDKQSANKRQASDKQATTNNNDNNDNKLLFDQFWKEYPEKKSKPTAEKAFYKALDKSSFENIMEGLNTYKQNKPKDIQFAHASTWLNQERWCDEYENKKPRQGRMI